MVSEVEERAISKLRWKLLPYLMLLYIMAMIDRVNVGFAALQMNADLGISPSMFGFIAGIFFIAYFFFEVPSNVIMHRVGARIWITRILISWGLVTVFTGFVQNSTQFGILRVLLGVAEAGFYPCIILYLTFWFPGKYFASAVSIFMCGMALANIITGPISTWIMENVAWMGLAGWRWLFVIEGLPAVLLGFVTYFTMIDRPEQAKFLEKDEKEWLLAELKKEHEAKAAFVPANKWDVFKMGKVWHLSFCYLCYVIALYGLGLWMPQIIKGLSKALSLTNIGLISTIPYFFAVVAMVLVARHSDKTGERKFHGSLPISIAFFGLIGLTMTNDLWVSMALICISQMGIYCFVGTFWCFPNMYLTEATAAVGIAIINSTANLGGFIGPYVVGFLKELSGGSTTLSMYFLASFAVMGTISVLALGKPPAEGKLTGK
ncbi:MFS transporter [Sporomusa sp. KB1]|jgi:MFS family permease|uniref:MFS transporter n=1 Tax=Sporomusa sp. KB1 TaxID=943346 RepID=UPI0011A1E57A|nr:MFS transporter [Sporomusa sp. KB1]TWH47325.1 sugar phosphate permease [Sporomusa sp. KB1]